MSRLDIRLLGPTEVEIDNESIKVDTRKAIALLAYLSVTGQPHRRDHLAALLWPESDQSRARAALRRTLSSLSNALGREHLEISRDSIGLSHDGQQFCDAAEFRRLLDAARADQPSTSELEAAVNLYRDDFMEGFSLRDSPAFDDWQYLEADSLRRALAGTLEQLTVDRAAAGEIGQAIEHATRWLNLDPLQESAHRQLMRLHASQGDRASAIQQYRECVQILDQELDVAPLEETTELYLAIMDGRFEATSKPLLAVYRAPAAPHAIQDLPLVGREEELEALIGAWESIEHDGRLIVVEGEAGIGKTRLSEELANHARAARAEVISAACYPGESDLAYGVVGSMLRSCLDSAGSDAVVEKIPSHVRGELSRIVPELAELNALTPQPLESPGALDRFHDAIIQFLLSFSVGDLPVLLSVDDFQWSDDASVSLLSYLIRRLHRTPICLLLTWRTEDVSQSHPYRAVLARSQRDGLATLVPLKPLTASDIDELVEGMAAESITDLSRALFAESEGVPFLAVEYLAVIEQDSPETDGEWPVPSGVRDLIHSRLAGVNSSGRQLLTTAAVIGRSFDLDMLQDASGRGEVETVETLDTLLSRGLIRDSDGHTGGSVTYDFGHEKVRSLIYDEMSLARRRLIHRRVAQSLEHQLRRQSDEGGMAGQIAFHFQAAGMETEAARYHRLAGDYARSLFGNIEALSHYRSALALGYPDPAELHELIGDLETLRGSYAEALQSYQTAAAHAEAERLPVIDRKLGIVRQRLGDWEIAERHYEAALAASNSHPPADRAKILADWSLTAHQRGETNRAVEIGRRTLTLSEESGDEATLAQTYNLLGILARSQGQTAASARHLEQSLRLAEKMPDPTAKIAGLNNLALICADQNLMERAIELTLEALDLCRSLGDRHREAALLNHLADFYHLVEDEPRSMAHLKEAVAIFAEIGQQTDTVRPEIWKLVEW